ncbi:MAG: hypothetical protein CMO80_03240 [Verrucomicrobiales bacterium]|nr:hypothetical protein [Verrucomicrobiales bacterium]|tara:strand:- start:4113 stop:4346 length:234 start_codon:yes stop_codon:yes gene_type:complete
MTPLHHIGELFRNLSLAIPMGAVRVIFLALLIGLLIWVLRLPKEATTPPEGTGKAPENLKLWASVALGLQILIYCCF